MLKEFSCSPLWSLEAGLSASGTSVPWDIPVFLETVLVVATGGKLPEWSRWGPGAAEHCAVLCGAACRSDPVPGDAVWRTRGPAPGTASTMNSVCCTPVFVETHRERIFSPCGWVLFSKHVRYTLEILQVALFD